MPRSTRVRLATGIYADNIGRSVVVSVNGTLYERRFPAETDLEHLRHFRDGWKTELAKPKKKTPRAGTLAHDVARYLATLPKAGTKKRNATLELGHWCAVFGRRSRRSLTRLQIQQQLTRWADAGVKPGTLRHRRRELEALYTALDGADAANPVRAVPKPRVRYTEARGFLMAAASMILGKFGRRGKSWARCRVIATTSLPQAQIARVQPRDMDLEARTIYITKRLKGGGTRARTIRLTRRGVAAWKAFIRLDCFGEFSRQSMARDFALAVDKAKARWARSSLADGHPWPAPKDVRPYDLRHTLLTDAYRRSRDLRAVAELGIHESLDTTKRYAEAAVSETLDQLIATMDAPRAKSRP